MIEEIIFTCNLYFEIEKLSYIYTYLFFFFQNPVIVSVFLNACYRRWLNISQLCCLFYVCPEMVLVDVCKMLTGENAMRLSQLWTPALFANIFAIYCV